MTNMMRVRLLFVFVLLLLVAEMKCQKGISRLEATLIEMGMQDVQVLDSTLLVDMKYATIDNFTKTVLYDSLTRAYLHPIAAKKLIKAHQLLKQHDPNLRLLIYDAARPLSVQKKMYDVVKGTAHAAYVANPAKVGMHNYGMAIDLTICDEKGKPLDMGTSFDFFGRAAAIRDEEGLIRQKILTREQVNNRKLLRKVMVDSGFRAILGEWWHFNAVSKSEAARSYKVIE